MSDEIIDISPPVDADLAVWPEDVAYQLEFCSRLEEGGLSTLASIRTTTHVGAHVDAPLHYSVGGAGVGQCPLEPFYGPCQVVEVKLPRGERVEPRHLTQPLRWPRILVKTGSYPDPTRFNDDFNGLSPAFVECAAQHEAVLLGIDTPSVDPPGVSELAAHRAVAAAGMALLEGLVLDHVAPGDYTLIALPLKLMGADASPVRAVLLRP